MLALVALSAGLAYFVKYTPALLPSFELPDEATSTLAALVIIVPSALNVAKWRQRSKEDAEFVGDF